MSILKKFHLHLKSRLLVGIIILIPVWITFVFFKFIMRFAYKISKGIIPPAFFAGEIHEYVILFLAFIFIALFVYLVGCLGSHYTGKKIIVFWENIISKIPLVKSIYNASKQIVKSLSFTSNEGFKAVAFVEFPTPGSYALGFITGTMKNTGNELLYKVFIPTTPNPTSGFLIFFPEKAVKLTDMNVETAIQTIVSAGIAGPEKINV